MKECGSATAYYEIRAQLKAESSRASSTKGPKLSLKEHTKEQKQRRLKVADMRRQTKESDRLARALPGPSVEECKEIVLDLSPLEYQKVSSLSVSMNLS